MFIRLLGPVELRTADGHAVEPAGAKRCAVLALLALELGRVVPVERLFELLWGETPPAQARAALQGHIAALRKQIAGSAFTLLTRAPGYRLDGPAELVDALRFERLTTRAAEECAPGGDEPAAELLREALDLWHGACALANLPETDLRHAVADRLDRHRTRALECWAERLLRLGRGADAIPDLDRAAAADGLYEPLAALLVRCLHQAGRFADALTVYRRTRHRLAEELGVPPGRVLQSAVDDVLAADPATAPARPPAPAGPRTSAPGPAANQLPRQAAGVVGRSAEQRWLEATCGGQRDTGSLAVVVGPAGAGKTATVVQWAHSAADAFPDGRLFADLNGFGPGPRTEPADVLARFLGALGVAQHELPTDRFARAALYRSLSHGRRLLVVLDDARDAADVADLLPAGPHCATVITSRSSLEDVVVTEGAALLRLGALPPDDALGLLEHLLTPARVRAEPEAAARVAALCDRLPLALRIAAARLAAQPGWAIADLVPELADERTRLQTLDTQGAMSVRGALGLTVRRLSADAVDLLALLAAHPGPETDAHAAAALLRTEPAGARRALGSLAAHHLLTEDSPGRYRQPDLVRLYGAELLAERPASDRSAATRALVDHFLSTAAHGAALLRPAVDPSGAPSLPAAAGALQLPDARSALDWFRSEEPTIRGLVASAAELGDHRRAWRLAHLADVLHRAAGRRSDRPAGLRTGLREVLLTGDRAAGAAPKISTASALSGVRRTERAAYAITPDGPNGRTEHVWFALDDAATRPRSAGGPGRSLLPDQPPPTCHLGALIGLAGHSPWCPAGAPAGPRTGSESRPASRWFAGGGRAPDRTDRTCPGCPSRPETGRPSAAGQVRPASVTPPARPEAPARRPRRTGPAAAPPTAPPRPAPAPSSGTRTGARPPPAPRPPVAARPPPPATVPRPVRGGRVGEPPPPPPGRPPAAPAVRRGPRPARSSLPVLPLPRASLAPPPGPRRPPPPTTIRATPGYPAPPPSPSCPPGCQHRAPSSPTSPPPPSSPSCERERLPPRSAFTRGPQPTARLAAGRLAPEVGLPPGCTDAVARNGAAAPSRPVAAGPGAAQ
ncbi:BTAD domain-containing putative transcriptional regulator [Kitasatospora sp. NPDC057015]|uniref:AfsR/SARP family transcriptional regulator n=1 Tax=Kitasatospora sp. NPDC057015 TaxID=3346001 RepID=UPI00363A92B3